MDASVEILPSNKIDISKWDNCIHNSSNALVYATSSYLNYLTDNWHGIVVNDYDCVMPIPWRRKFGTRYTYDVPFMQQLGWFNAKSMNDDADLIQILFSFCKYGDYAFNYNNNILINNVFASTNYIVNLSESYEALIKRYNTDLTNNLKKAYKQELIYSNGDYNTAIDLYKDLYHQKTPQVLNSDFENFKKLCAHLWQSNNVIVRNVVNPKNELLATTLLLKDERRLYNLMNSTTQQGRKTEANHFLFDSIFKEFSQTNLVFDFEGSDIPGIKNFYEKFGAINQPYYKLHFNHLPFPLNILKR